MALNGTSEQIVLDCDFSYDSEDQLLVSSFVSLIIRLWSKFDDFVYERNQPVQQSTRISPIQSKTNAI